MERKEILGKLETVYRDILNDDTIVLTEGTSADDIDAWDSITNVQIVAEVQDIYGLKFSASEILNWKRVGDIIEAVISKNN